MRFDERPGSVSDRLMGTDLDHLPGDKRRELDRVVQILFEEFESAPTDPRRDSFAPSFRTEQARRSVQSTN